MLPIMTTPEYHLLPEQCVADCRPWYSRQLSYGRDRLPVVDVELADPGNRLVRQRLAADLGLVFTEQRQDGLLRHTKLVDESVGRSTGSVTLDDPRFVRRIESNAVIDVTLASFGGSTAILGNAFLQVGQGFREVRIIRVVSQDLHQDGLTQIRHQKTSAREA